MSGIPRSTWVVQRHHRTHPTKAYQRGTLPDGFANRLHGMLSMTDPVDKQSMSDALTEMNSLSGVLFTSCLDCVVVDIA